MRSTTAGSRLAFATLTGWLAATLTAQCEPTIVPGPGFAGPNVGALRMIEWDPDGAGPLAPRVVVAGSFLVAGNQLARGVATYDPTTTEFAPLGEGLGGQVTALGADAAGGLLAGGRLQVGGGPEQANVARWNGTTWQPLAPTPPPLTFVRAVAVLPNGDVMVGGRSGTTAHLARWDGVGWTTIGGLGGIQVSPLLNPVEALLALPNGDLLVGGVFETAGGISSPGVARWDGQAWHGLLGGVTFTSTAPGWVFALALLPNQDVAIGGQFELANGQFVNNVARWNGSSFQGFSFGMPSLGSRVQSLVIDGTGSLLAAGQFQFAGTTLANGIARWDGAAWQSYGLGAGSMVPAVLGLPNGEVLAGGGFAGPGMRRWNGSAWVVPRAGYLGRAQPLLRLRDGRLLVGGDYRSPAQPGPESLAMFDGTTWSSVGGGVAGVPLTAVELDHGDLVVAGLFSQAGGVPVSNIARWSGGQWSPLGGLGTNGIISRILRLPNGDLLAVGSFSTIGGVAATYLARWDGVAWTPFAAAPNSLVTDAVVEPDGAVVVTGAFTQIGGQPLSRIARWRAGVWSPLGSGLGGSTSSVIGNFLVRLRDGALVVLGSFETAGGVAAPGLARWDGSQWSALGRSPTMTIRAIAGLPDGDLVVAGQGGENTLLRWDGQNWSVLTSATFEDDGTAAVASLLVASTGDVWAGGNFETFGGLATASLVKLAPSCPAGVVATPSACTSPVAAALAADELPWVGGGGATVATGLPLAAFAFVVTGTTPASLPLAAVFTTAQPGCALQVAPDVVTLALSVGGSVRTAFTVPNSVTFAGFVLHQQVVALDLAPGNPVTATNALAITVGAL